MSFKILYGKVKFNILAKCELLSTEICRFQIMLDEVPIKHYGWFDDTGEEYEVVEDSVWNMKEFQAYNDTLEIIRASESFTIEKDKPFKVTEIFEVAVAEVDF